MKLILWLTLIVVAALAPLSAADLGLMHNFDGDYSFTGDTPEQSKTKLQQFIDAAARRPVKTLMWSIGAGSDILLYPTKVASTWGWRYTKYNDDPKWKTRIERARVATAAGLDAPRIVAERCRERGLKFFPSYRMNDGHFTGDPLHYPLTGRFWLEHQDATIGKSPIAGFAGYQHLFNFARDEVRAYRLAVIFEAIDRYADLMEGFELDFNRFQLFFAPGEADKHAPLITDMVRQVRERLNAVGAKQGRPMTLVVRVPPALHNCTWSGLDVGEWMKRRLVDVVIPAQLMTLAHDMPVDEFARLAKPAGVQVFGSIYGRSGYNWPFTANHATAAYARPVTRTPDAAQVLGSMLNQRYLGASGFQLFNFLLSESNAPMTSVVAFDLANTPLADRRYQVTQGYYHDREDTYEYRKQLPIALHPNKPVSLRLLIGEDLAKADPKPGYVALRLGLSGANKAYSSVAMRVNINGHQIHNGATTKNLVVTTGTRHGNGSHPPPTEAYVQWAIADLTTLHAGWNTINVILAPAVSAKPLQLVETEIGVLVESVKVTAAEWESVAPLPEPNGGMICYADGEDIIVAGGTNWDNDTKRWLTKRWRFNSTWKPLPPLPAPLAYANIAGGFTAGGSDGQKSTDSILEWKADRLPRQLARLPQPLTLAGTCLTDGRLFIIGGAADIADLSTVTARCFEWRDKLNSLPDYPAGPTAMPAVAAGKRGVFAFAGATWDATTKQVVNRNAAFALDLATRTWKPIRPYPFAARGVTAVALNEKHIFLAGGYKSAEEGFTDDSFIYDIASDRYEPAVRLPIRGMVHLVKTREWLWALGGEDALKHRSAACWRIRLGEPLLMW